LQADIEEFLPPLPANHVRIEIAFYMPNSLCEPRRQFEAFSVGLKINQDEVGPDVAVSVIVPFSGKRVIDIACRQRRIVNQKFQALPRRSSSFLPRTPDFSRR
jgi:hypothetical protein